MKNITSTLTYENLIKGNFEAFLSEVEVTHKKDTEDILGKGDIYKYRG